MRFRLWGHGYDLSTDEESEGWDEFYLHSGTTAARLARDGPHGLSFAQAGPGFENGWRWMYAVGALLAAIGVMLRLELPESARWLVGQGRLDEPTAWSVTWRSSPPSTGRCRRSTKTSRSTRRARSAGAPSRPAAQPHVLQAGDPAPGRVVPRLRHRVRVLGRVHRDAELAQLRAVRGRPDHRRGRVRLSGLRPVRGGVRRGRRAQVLAGDRRGDHGGRRDHRGRGRDHVPGDRVHRLGGRVLRLQHLGAGDLHPVDPELPHARA